MNTLKQQTLYPTGIYYIEVTGLAAEGLKGKTEFGNSEPGSLGKILKANEPKKVALKLGAIPGLTDMSYCFYGCKNLTQAPVIPNGVTGMSGCFSGCTKLTSVTLKCNFPSSIPNVFEDAFKDCNSLAANSIKVPAGQLSAYQGGASNMRTTADRFIAE